MKTIIILHFKEPILTVISEKHTPQCLFTYKQFDTVYIPEVTPGVDRSSVTYPSAKVKM